MIALVIHWRAQNALLYGPVTGQPKASAPSRSTSRGLAAAGVAPDAVTLGSYVRR